jgi:phosphatidylinositol-3-phosphatase
LKRVGAAATVAVAALLLLASPAAGELAEPVSVTAAAPPTVLARVPFRLSTVVRAEPGALDIAAQPLRLRVRFAPECGGSFAGTEGPTAVDRVLPAPSPGRAYEATVAVSAKLGAPGPATVCAFLEDGQERQFATDTEETLTVVPAPCRPAKRNLARLKRKLRHTHKAKLRHRLHKRLRKARRRVRRLCAGRATASEAPSLPADVPQIKHLFVIALENENAEETFGPNPPSPYLGQTLREQGAFIPNYYGIGHESLDNYIAMVSGQPPNLQTQADCQIYSEMAPGTVREDGIALGSGCVYPRSVRTIANQLENSGQSWRAYMQDMANSVAAGEPGSCRHPAIGAIDETQRPRAGDQYAARHNPFVYFHSIVDYPTCQQNDVDLSQLPIDLQSTARTPSYSFITPDLCADGHEATCADASEPAGFAGIDAFLREWVPRIEASAAYRDQGAILVTFDESASGASSCCNEPSGPNTPNNGGPEPGSGGGRVGAVMVSPCIRPGTITQTAYNHYSFLRWSEDNFGLAHLASAGAEGLKPFGSDVFTKPSCDPELLQAGQRARARVRLKVKPRHVVAGTRRVYRFRVISRVPECRRNVRIRFAGGATRTDRKGKARMRLRISRPGKRFAYALPKECPRARAGVRILKG